MDVQKGWSRTVQGGEDSVQSGDLMRMDRAGVFRRQVDMNSQGNGIVLDNRSAVIRPACYSLYLSRVLLWLPAQVLFNRLVQKTWNMKWWAEVGGVWGMRQTRMLLRWPIARDGHGLKWQGGGHLCSETLWLGLPGANRAMIRIKSWPDSGFEVCPRQEPQKTVSLSCSKITET